MEQLSELLDVREVPEPRRSLLLSLLDALRAHLIAARFILTAGATKVSTTNAYLLAELELDPQLNVPRLAEILCLNKSSVSRGLKQLLDQGYLSLDKGGASRNRRKGYQLTAKAERFLAQDRRSDEKLVAHLSSRLIPSKLERLAAYLERFADGAKSAPLPTLPHALDGASYRIFQSFRRLTRSHGVTSGNYLGSGYGVDVWVLLSEIFYRKRKSTELSALMKFEPKMLAQLLRGYKKLAWVHISSNDDDRRINQLEIAEAGNSVLRQIEESAVGCFCSQLGSLSDRELQELVNLLRGYAGADFPPRVQILENGAAQMRALRSADELLQARWLLVRQVSQMPPQAYALGASLFSPDNLCLGVFRDARLVAALEISAPGTPRSQVLNSCGEQALISGAEFVAAVAQFSELSTSFFEKSSAIA